MKRVSYTPGPWRAQGNLIFGAAPGAHVCKLFTQHVPGEKSGAAEEKSNARLIAAAPEMYAALLEAEIALKGMLGGTCLSSVLEAIAKARGDKAP